MWCSARTSSNQSICSSLCEKIYEFIKLSKPRTQYIIKCFLSNNSSSLFRWANRWCFFSSLVPPVTRVQAVSCARLSDDSHVNLHRVWPCQALSVSFWWSAWLAWPTASSWHQTYIPVGLMVFGCGCPYILIMHLFFTKIVLPWFWKDMC